MMEEDRLACSSILGCRDLVRFLGMKILIQGLLRGLHLRRYWASA